MRKALLAATEFFVLFEEPERTAIPVANVQAIIETCNRRASEFQAASPSRRIAPPEMALFFISKNFTDPRLSDRPIEVLYRLLSSLEFACNAALGEVSEFAFIKQGDRWEVLDPEAKPDHGKQWVACRRSAKMPAAKQN